MRALTLTALVLTLALPPVAVHAQESGGDVATIDMQQIEEAWAREDFEFARQGLEQLAQETGSALAQYRYGRILLEGRGGPTDIDGAVMWLERAVAQNHAEAAALLARIYLTDFDQDAPLETQRSPERAADLLILSATLGFAEGQYQLARLYGAGLGVPKDDKAAFRWLLAASREQHPKAQLALALAYSQGLGTDRNDAEALNWLSAAADNGNVQAQVALARNYETGNGVAKSLARALALYRNAAESGSVAAQTLLGSWLLLGGEGVTASPDDGVEWLTYAARSGDPDAMVVLGKAYANGTGVAQSTDLAALWYSRAAQFEHGEAKAAFAAMLEAGQGVAADFDAAITLYQAALTLPGGESAAIRLGELAASGTLDGRFAPQRMTPWALAAMRNGSAEAETWLLAQAGADLRDAQAGLAAIYLASPETAEQGVEWLQKAARGGDTQAQLRLGKMYITGDTVPLDYELAHQWLNIAATLGQPEAEELRSTVASLMTPDQVATAQAGAREWLASGQRQPPATNQSVTETDGMIDTVGGRN